MWGSNPSRIPRYPRPDFSSTRTFELMDWFKRDSGLIIKTGSALESGSLLKGLAGCLLEAALPLLPRDPCGVHEEPRLPEDVHPDDPVGPISERSAIAASPRTPADGDAVLCRGWVHIYGLSPIITSVESDTFFRPHRVRGALPGGSRCGSG